MRRNKATESGRAARSFVLSGGFERHLTLLLRLLPSSPWTPAGTLDSASVDFSSLGGDWK